MPEHPARSPGGEQGERLWDPRGHVDRTAGRLRSLAISGRTNRAQAVAVTTYHGVFNSNPRIDAAQTLVLDDAHAGEGAVADLWPVTAKRSEGTLYEALLASVIAALPDAFAERMRDAGLDPWRRNEAELVPPRAVSAHAGVLREALGAHAGGHNAYASEMIADALEYCLVYVSWNEILVRPLIPPTSEHHPFADAQQRIYMSATFGSGGELERSFGVPRIERLPVATMANGKSPI